MVLWWGLLPKCGPVAPVVLTRLCQGLFNPLQRTVKDHATLWAFYVIHTFTVTIKKPEGWLVPRVYDGVGSYEWCLLVLMVYIEVVETAIKISQQGVCLNVVFRRGNRDKASLESANFLYG